MKATQCSIDGCDRSNKMSRGMCGMHYERWRIHGTTDLFRPSPAKRLAVGLEHKSNGCLEWTGARLPTGYGQIHVNGGVSRVHRLAWELANGQIPDGLFVLHHCDNPPCCQTEPTGGYPDGHLFLGTDADNMADRDAKGRQWNQRKTHCKYGHEFTEANTYVIPSRPGRYCRTCRRIRKRAARNLFVAP